MAAPPNPGTGAGQYEPAYDPILPGHDGPRSKRGSEKKIEAKDVIKFLSPSNVFQGRIVSPSALLQGGGSADFIMRGDFKTRQKMLTWGVGVAPFSVNDGGSFVRRGTFDYGPLAAWSESSANSGVSLGAAGSVGIPIPFDTLVQGGGAYTYVMESLLLLNLTGALAQQTSIGMIWTAFFGPNLVLPSTFPFNQQAGGGLTLVTTGGAPAVGGNGTGYTVVKQKLTFRVAPAGTGDVSNGALNVTAVTNSPFGFKITVLQELAWWLPPVAILPQNNYQTIVAPFHAYGTSTFFINRPTNQKFLYIDAGIQGLLALDPTSQVTLLSSRGYSAGLPDSYPYDLALLTPSTLPFPP